MADRSARPARSPFVEVPAADAVLSVFDEAKSGCVWLRLDPVAGKHALVAAFDGHDCRGARVTWSPDGKRALVWFDADNATSPSVFVQGLPRPLVPPDGERRPPDPHRLYEVELESAKVRPLPFLADGEIDDFVFEQGRPVALALQLLPEGAPTGKITVDGKEYDPSTIEEGVAALAHAYAFEGGGWKRIETQVTDTEWDGALGVGALEASKIQVPRSYDLLLPHRELEEADPDHQAALMKLYPELAKVDGAAWGWLQTQGGKVAVLRVEAELSFNMGALAFLDGAPSKPEGLGMSAGDSVALDARGPFLLVSSDRSGARARLYDVKARKLIWSTDRARAVVFWPK